MTPAALDLAELLLAYDPAQRATAVQALEAPYFNQEQPPAERPVGCVHVMLSFRVYFANTVADCRPSKGNGTNWRRSASARRSVARLKVVHNKSITKHCFA